MVAVHVHSCVRTCMDACVHRCVGVICDVYTCMRVYNQIVLRAIYLFVILYLCT